MADDRGVRTFQFALIAAAGIALALGLGDIALRHGAGAAPAASPDPLLLAAGDIASCASTGDEATALLLDALPGDVATIGDNVYESGSAAEYANCYDPTWGRAKARTHPAPGNHEYNTPGAGGYFLYFGAAAGSPSQSYYSYDLGAWHIISLDSDCTAIAGGCGAGSAEERWLRLDLASHPADCTLAYWHHPRFSSGLHGNEPLMQPIWQALYDYGADVVLSGHDHDYERFAPQTPAGLADGTSGIREFVVGTGGRSHYAVGALRPNSEISNSDTYGVLQLTLHATGFDWQFVPEAGKTFSDSGTGTCHAPTQPDTDADGWIDATDNCPANPNNDQKNSDGNFVDLPPSRPFDDLTWVNSDSAGDVCDPDDDNDGIPDAVEVAGPPCGSASAATDPLKLDTDSDGFTDGAECALGTDPASAGSAPPRAPAGDSDHDGVSDATETALGTNPAAPDSDGDTVLDGVEFLYYGSNPLSPNSDSDICGDGREVASVNDDTRVNSTDQLIVAQSYSSAYQPKYVLDFDINRDTKINSTDSLLVAKSFGVC